MAYHLEFCPYYLQPKRPLNRFSVKKIEGLLLRFHFSDHSIGYSSLQCWESLGDRPLKEELKALQNKKPLNLGAHALDFAQRDALARKEQYKLYGNLTTESHYSLGVPEKVEIPPTFDRLKIKLDRDFSKTLKQHTWLKDYKLRIDFNLALQKQDEDKLLNALKDFSIDFIEDAGITLNAYTEFFDEIKGQARHIIIKPAKEYLIPPQDRVIFTSYMDHPVGQVHAAKVAEDFYRKHPDKKEICGLRSDLLFTDNPFLEYFAKNQNPISIADDGYGIGFTSLLEKQIWQQ